MFIEKVLEGEAADLEEGQGEGVEERVVRKLKAILSACESLEVELGEMQARGVASSEVSDLSRRVGAVRATAEEMLESEEG